MSWFYRLNLLSVALCFALVAFGAYVRLSDAGLSCPDWPGCYGQLTVPDGTQGENAPRLLEAPKAWKEMIHRYLAGTVGLLIAVLAALAWRQPQGPRRLAGAIVAVVLAQIVFGALTVTMKVNPLIVTTHLLLGLATLSLLWWMWLGGRPATVAHAGAGLRSAAGLALTLLVAQLFLGGWTSTNYAALACPDFPTCLGRYTPATPLGAAFTLWHGADRNYEFGILDVAARATVHLVHRYGALVTVFAVGALGLHLAMRKDAGLWRRLGLALLAALALQAAIGIGLIELQVPLWLADAHNAGAALLLLTLVAVNAFAWRWPGALNLQRP